MNQRIKVLAILPALMPSTVILGVEPLMHLVNLEKIELRLRLENLFVRPSDLDWADLVFFCRNTEPTHDFLPDLLRRGKPYLYELDDNFFEIPLDVRGGPYHRGAGQIAQLEKYLLQANLVRVFSPALEARVRQYSSRVRVVKAPINLSSIPADPPKRDPQKLRIVFPTSRTVADNLAEIFIKDLARVLREYPNRVEVHFWGFLPEQLRGVPSVKFHRFISNYPNYMQALYREGYDIGLAPMKNDVFYNSKTNNKFREYSACWIAGIYSNTDLYAGCVEDGRTGLLVSNEEGAWYSAIVKLMTDSPLRETIQTQARAFVEQEYSLDRHALLLFEHVHHMLREGVTPGVFQAQPEIREAKNDPSRKPISVFSRLIRAVMHALHKTYSSIQNYGIEATVRLMIEQIERYTLYFQLLWKTSRK